MADDSLPAQDSLTEDPAVVDRHRRLAELLDVWPGQVVADLGCGDGVTLGHVVHAIGERWGGIPSGPGAPGGPGEPPHPSRAPGLVVGVDRDAAALARATRALTGTGAGAQAPALLAADLGRGVPLRAGSVDRIVSHNVLESLPESGRFLDEAHRVLRPGGRLVLGHADFDTLVFAGADVDLTRRIVHAYCDTQQAWMSAVDGTIGRRLAGLAAASPLRLVDLTAWVLVSREWRPGMLGHGYAHHVAEALDGDDAFPPRVRSGWLAELEAAAAESAFLFSLNEYVAVLERP